MKLKLLVLSLLALFAFGCSGMQTQNSGGDTSSGSGKILTKEKLKSLGIEESKGTDY